MLRTVCECFVVIMGQGKWAVGVCMWDQVWVMAKQQGQGAHMVVRHTFKRKN